MAFDYLKRRSEVNRSSEIENEVWQLKKKFLIAVLSFDYIIIVKILDFNWFGFIELKKKIILNLLYLLIFNMGTIYKISLKWI